MKTADHSIERNVKLIAVVGGVIFVTLVAALFIVQTSLGDSQSELGERVVPMQGGLNELSSGVGRMFLRESEIVAAERDALPALAERQSYLDALRHADQKVDGLLETSELEALADFPRQAVEDLDEDMEAFAQADADLFATVSKYRDLQHQLNESVATLDGDLRKLTEASAGVAGVLRLEYVSLLRSIVKGLDAAPNGAHDVSAADIRKAILGDSRAQLAAIDELDQAVLRLGVLAGKVGLAPSKDAMNSLVANELVQNRAAIMQALGRIERLVTDPAVSERVKTLHGMAEDLAKRVGDETLTTSLASLRRQVLAEKDRVRVIQAAAAAAATRLESDTRKLHVFSESLAADARDSASLTIDTSRVATLIVVVIGLFLAIVGGLRVRSSVYALRAQNQKLTDLSADLARVNAGLEETVAQRTAALQLVLDSTGDGMLSVDLDGALLPERSRAVADWFGPAANGQHVWDYLAPNDQTARDALWVGFDQLASDVMPFDVSAAQAPATLARDQRSFALTYREVEEKGKLARVLVLIRDVTAELEGRRAERDARELHAVMKNLIADRAGFQQSVDECAAILAEVVASSDTLVIKRGLHTLKGNSAILGFESMAEHVHELESRLAEDERDPSASELVALEQAWQACLHKVEEHLDGGAEGHVAIDVDDLDTLADMARRRSSYDDIVAVVESWRHEPAAAPLHRLAAQARHVARRLEKPVEVTVDHHRVRVPAERLRAFWSTMVHVVRNAVDHGLDDAQARALAAKPVAGQVRLESRVDGDFLEIAVSDDGRGVDWEAVRERAAARGLPSITHEDLVQALFADGLTTKLIATDISGRGVGLGAVKAACRELGAQVSVTSAAGRGTRFAFRFALAAIGAPAVVRRAA